MTMKARDLSDVKKKWEVGGMSKKYRQPLKAEKDKEIDSSFKAIRRNQTSDGPWF